MRHVVWLHIRERHEHARAHPVLEHANPHSRTFTTGTRTTHDEVLTGG